MRKLYLLTFLICLIFIKYESHAQTNSAIWSPVGSIDSKYEVMHLKTISNDLYACLYSFSDSGYVVAKWNGLYWMYYPLIHGDFKEKNSFDVLNDTLFVIYSVNVGGSIKHRINKFNGSSWVNVPVKFSVLADTLNHFMGYLKTVKNVLYVFGYIKDSTGTEVGVLKYNNGDFSPEGPSGAPGVQGKISDISVYNNTLMLQCDFLNSTTAKSNGKRSVNLLWDGVNWQTHNTLLDSNSILCNDHDTIFLRIGKDCVRYVNKTYSIINSNFTNFLANEFIAIQGKYYALGNFSVNNGANYFYGLVTRKNGAWYLIEPSSRTAMLGFNNRLTSKSQTAGRHVEALENGLAYISGNVYLDVNTNCKRETNEIGIAQRKITIMPDNFSVISDYEGNYFATVIPGVKSLISSSTFVAKYLIDASCTSAIKTVTAIVDSNKSIDFPLAEKVTTDIAVKVMPNGGHKIRKSSQDLVTVQVRNQGSTTISNAVIKLKIDPNLTIISALPAYTSYANNIITWNKSNFKRDSVLFFMLSVQLSVASNIGDSIYYIASVTPNPDDDTTDNRDTVKCKVVYSYDPNDKQCDPPNVILATTDKLKYTIRFQNTGTSYAENVRIVDTLDNKLPLEKILITGWSTPTRPKIEVRGGNVLVFTFDHIMLPDSFSDEKGSHGFISYSCGLYKNLPLGAKITNRADIYFDYNAAVPTNRTENIQTEKVGINDYHRIQLNNSVSIFPNPANAQIIITSKNGELNLITLLDINGKEISRVQTHGNNSTTIDTALLPEGIYFIRLSNSNQSIVKKVVIQH